MPFTPSSLEEGWDRNTVDGYINRDIHMDFYFV